MLRTVLLALFCAFASTISAAAVKRASSVTAADITKIAPLTSSCANAPVAGECRTAEQAAPNIAISFTNFGITSFGEQAALVALMLYESGNFKYSKNHYPGVPGQGTRNMQTPTNNLHYAQYLSTVCTNCGFTPSQIQQAQSDPAAVLALVNTDQWSFGSAAWFLATQCSTGIRQGLAGGTLDGWHNYLQQCVGTSSTPERDHIWTSAIALKAW